MRQLSVMDFPEMLHQKIEKYRAQILVNEDRKLTKEATVIELIAKATKDITVPDRDPSQKTRKRIKQSRAAKEETV